MTAGEFFGTLQQSVVETWKSHLKTDKYSKHKALNEFYDDAPELVDTLIEDYMGVTGEKIEDYKNTLDEGMGTIEYLKALRKMCEDNREEYCSESELSSDLDAILSLIDGTLYKLEQLTESDSFRMRSLAQYLTESMQDICESKGIILNRASNKEWDKLSKEVSKTTGVLDSFEASQALSVMLNDETEAFDDEYISANEFAYDPQQKVVIWTNGHKTYSYDPNLPECWTLVK